jgi:hypothetical protein
MLRFVLFLPAVFLFSGCWLCNDHIRVKNRTDDTVVIRYQTASEDDPIIDGIDCHDSIPSGGEADYLVLDLFWHACLDVKYHDKWRTFWADVDFLGYGTIWVHQYDVTPHGHG